MSEDRRAAQAFGRELARTRKLAGMTQDALANALGFSSSHMSNLERGRRVPALDVLPEIDQVLNSSRHLTELWHELTGNGRQAWLYEFSEMVCDASAVNEYQMLTFPGYLQTEGYGLAVIRAGAPWLPPSEVARRAAERAHWGKRVQEAETPILWIVADQSLLWRRYGGSAVMQEQLTHVVGLIERERLSFQLVPADTTRHPGTSGTFAVLAGQGPEVVYAESIHSGQFVTAQADVLKYRTLFGALQGAALGLDETLAMIKKESESLEP